MKLLKQIKFYLIIVSYLFLTSDEHLLAQSENSASKKYNDSLIYYRNFNANKAIENGKTGLQIAKKEQDTAWCAIFSNNISGCFLAVGMSDSVIKYSYESMEYYKILESNIGVLWCRYYIGYAYSLKGMHEKAVSEFDFILNDKDIIKTKSLKKFTLQAMGSIYYQQAMYHKAAEIFKKTLEASVSDTLDFIDNSINFGATLIELQMSDSALLVLYKAIEYASQKELRLKKAFILNNISEAWQELERYEDAEKSIDEAILIREEAGDSLGMSSSYRIKGCILINKQEYSKACDYFFKSLKILEVLNIPNNIVETYCMIGECMQYMQNHYAAIAYFQKAKEISRQIGAAAEIEYALKGEALSWMALNETKKAMTLMKQYINKHDSIQKADAVFTEKITDTTNNEQKHVKMISSQHVNILLLILLSITVIILAFQNISLRNRIKKDKT